jgi:antitoxin ParD1/3/4
MATRTAMEIKSFLQRPGIEGGFRLRVPGSQPRQTVKKGFGFPTPRSAGGWRTPHKYDKVRSRVFAGGDVSQIERMTITMPGEMAAVVKEAVAGGDYASTSEVVREALRDWKLKRALRLQELTALQSDIDKGLADLAEGRVVDFDADRIIERGRKLLAARSNSS